MDKPISLSQRMSQDKSAQQSLNERHAIQQVQNWTLKLQGHTTLEDLFGDVLAAIETLTDSFAQRIHLFDPEVGTYKLVRFAGLPASSKQDVQQISVAEHTLCSEALRTGKPVIVEDIASTPLLNNNEALRARMLAFEARSAYCVPLCGAGETTLGVLSVFFREAGARDANVLFLSDIIAAQTSGLIERIQIAERLKVAERRATLGQLAIALAHEVNNPLQALTNLLVLLSNQMDRNNEMVDSATEALKQVNRISALMVQMNELRPALAEDLQRTVSSMYTQ